MADLKITQLPSASIATSSDVLPIVQEGVTDQITVTDLGQGILNLGLDANFGDVTITGSIDITGSGTLNGGTILTSYDTGSFVTSSILPLNYGLFNQTGSSTPISASISELSLIGGGVGTLTVPANAFRKGDGFNVVLIGYCNFHNNDTFQIRTKTDGIVLGDTGVMILTGAADKFFRFEMFFTINETGSAGVASISSGGTFIYNSDAADKYNGSVFNITNSSSFDTTVDNTLDITGQFNHPDNIIYSNIFTLNKTF